MRLKKFVLALLLFIAFPALGSAQELMSRGWIVSSHSNDSDAAPDAGLYFSVPQGQSVTITLQSSFAVNPASVTIQLQTSLDASVWTTIVSSTAVAGESITAYNQVTKYVRANVSARSGGSGVTTQLVVNYSYGGSYLTNLLTTPLFLPCGTKDNPGFSWAGDTNTGFWCDSADVVNVTLGGTTRASFRAGSLALISSGALGWSSGDPTVAGIDTLFSRKTANTPGVNLGNASQGQSASVGGVLCVNTTSAATTGTTEEILATCTIPANAMSANGKGVRVTVSGTTAANANGKTLRIRFGGIGGTVVMNLDGVFNATPLYATANIYRTGAATQVAIGIGTSHALASQVTDTAPTQTLSNAIDIVVTGLTATAAGDLTFKSLIVEFFN